MINDKQRREAARGIRQFLSVSQNERAWDNDGLQTVGRLVGTPVGENILARLAELIDRPTCFDTESKDSKSFTCSACGLSESKLAISPFTLSSLRVKPGYRYCPRCGAEVVERGSASATGAASTWDGETFTFPKSENHHSANIHGAARDRFAKSAKTL